MTWKNSQFMIFRGTVEELRAFTVSKGHERVISVFHNPNIEGVLHWCSFDDPNSVERASLMGLAS